MLYPYELPSPSILTTAQLDGVECVYCAHIEPPTKPVGHLRGAQVFAHLDCADNNRMESLSCPE